MGLEATFLKVSQLSKDIKLADGAKFANIKSKDLVSILSEQGEEVKAAGSLSESQFGLFFEALTNAHKVEDITPYLNGEVTITVAASDKVIPASKKVEEKPGKATEEKTQEKKPAESKKAQPEKPQQAAAASAKLSHAEPEKVQQEKPAEPKKPEVKETVAPQVAPKPARPVYNIPAKAISSNPRPSVAGTKPQPFPSRTQSTAQGQGRPGYPQQKPLPSGSRPAFRGASDVGSGQSAVAKSNAELLAEMNLGRYGAPKQNAKNQKGGKGAKGANKGGFGQNRYDGDKDFGGSVPHEKYKAPEIIRSATTASSRGATRVIDTRSSTVDMDKYNQSYDDFAPDVEDERISPQKVKKTTETTNLSRKPLAKGGKGKPVKKQKMIIPKQIVTAAIPDEIVVSDLASRLKVTAAEVVKKLIGLGVMATVNETIDFDTAALVADELGAVVTKEVVVTIEDKLFDNTEDAEENLVERAPVVCVMGHVDHGKTSLLDAIRHTNVTEGEAGGITQHIGAYRVSVKGKNITFLDTPGHEAFTAMRARGAMATDIAILVVAADDGIMPQTIEAINHAKAAGVDIIVAINKIDKPGADPETIKQELTKYDLVPEEWGGDIICVPVSAKTKQGIDDLLENILLVAEVKELRANPNRRAKGLIIEAKLDKGFGPVATVLVQNGTLRLGDIVIAGTAVGRVRLMKDSSGKAVKEAGPSVPVEIIGLADVPQAGDEFAAVDNERMARELADQRKDKAKQEVFKANARTNLDDLFSQINEGMKDLPIIVKADVDGSVEAVRQSLEKLSNEEVRVRVIHAAAGGITEGDVMLATASNAIIVGFNVRPDRAALDSAERQGVDIRTYRIIYDCIEEISAAMKGMLAPKFREALLGHAEVRQVIHVPNVGFIAGSYVQDGKITRQSKIRVIRDGVVIFEDKVASLRRFKDDVREVAVTYECGIGLEKFNDMRAGDILEAYVMEEITEA